MIDFNGTAKDEDKVFLIQGKGDQLELCIHLKSIGARIYITMPEDKARELIRSGSNIFYLRGDETRFAVASSGEERTAKG